MDEWKEWRKKQEELEQERKRKQEEIEKRARILREQTAPKKDAHGCVIGEEKWNEDLHQCVKIVKPTPTKEQIPAQPVVPVGPVTVEQKVAALNDKVAEIEKLLSNLYGLTGHSLQEVKTVLGLK